MVTSVISPGHIFTQFNLSDPFLISFSHLQLHLLSDLFPWVFTTKIYAFLVFCPCYMPCLLDLSTLTVYKQEFQSFSLCNVMPVLDYLSVKVVILYLICAKQRVTSTVQAHVTRDTRDRQEQISSYFVESPSTEGRLSSRTNQLPHLSRHRRRCRHI
jgi:hypothetical protein